MHTLIEFMFHLLLLILQISQYFVFLILECSPYLLFGLRWPHKFTHGQFFPFHHLQHLINGLENFDNLFFSRTKDGFKSFLANEGLQHEDGRCKFGDGKPHKLVVPCVFPHQVQYPRVFADVFGNAFGMFYNLIHPL